MVREIDEVKEFGILEAEVDTWNYTAIVISSIDYTNVIYPYLLSSRREGATAATTTASTVSACIALLLSNTQEQHQTQQHTASLSLFNTNSIHITFSSTKCLIPQQLRDLSKRCLHLRFPRTRRSRSRMAL